jgi:phage head maturation protease
MTLGTIKGTALWYNRLCTRRLDGKPFYMRLAPNSLFVPENVPLRIDHNDVHNVAGAGLTFEDDGERLSFRATIPNTTDGRIALWGVRDGTRAGASLGLSIRESEVEEVDGDAVMTVTRARVKELSLVDQPAIRGCAVEEANSEDDQTSDDIDRYIAITRELRWSHWRLLMAR